MLDLEIIEIESLLKKIGKSVFVEILYPEIIKNDNVSWQELSDKYALYAKFTDNSKRSRLSSARRIVRNGWGKRALEIISESNIENSVREHARQLLINKLY
ncbi:MAG: hypothetical protein J6T87_10040 [Bacteroidales bacterium]|nr:hypothetical protein [Bacteroidales bacterium]